MVTEDGTDDHRTGVHHDGGTVERDQVAPEEAFKALQNRIRLAILRTLWDESEEPTTYSKLKRQIPVETDNFHYHLEQLVGRFVRRTEDGYELSYAGHEVVRAIVSGLITDDISVPPVEIESPCPFCGGVVELEYVDEQLSARCTTCPGVIRDEDYQRGTILQYDFPPSGVLGRSPDELYETAHILYDAKITAMLSGICSECAAPVDVSANVCEDHRPDTDALCPTCRTRFSVWAVYRCELCNYSRQFVPWFKLFTEPTVIAFYHDHTDFDLRIPFSKLTWTGARYIEPITQSVDSTDPLRIRIDITLDRATLTATLNEHLEVTSLEEVTTHG